MPCLDTRVKTQQIHMITVYFAIFYYERAKQNFYEFIVTQTEFACNITQLLFIKFEGCYSFLGPVKSIKCKR